MRLYELWYKDSLGRKDRVGIFSTPTLTISAYTRHLKTVPVDCFGQLQDAYYAFFEVIIDLPNGERQITFMELQKRTEETK